MIDGDSGAARGAALDAVAEPDHQVRPSVPRRVAQRDDEAARRGLVVPVVPAAPGVDVHDAARRHSDVPRVPDAAGEYRRAESG